jgi:hypothetical protein
MSTHYNPLIVRDGLIVNVDAANKLSYPGTGNTWFDLSKTGKNGTLSGGTLFSSDFGGVMNFDGVNDVVNFGTGNTFFPLPQFTIDVWFRSFGTVNVTGTSPALFGFTYGIRLLVGSTQLSYTVHDGTSFAALNTSGSTPFRGGGWYNVVVYHTGTNKGIYVNSTLRGSMNRTWLGTTFAGNSWNLGRDNNDSFYFFHGQIASYKMYNRVLSSQEVKHNFNATRRRFGV